MAMAERRYQARETFGTLGYPKLADLFLKEHPEQEATAEVASEYIKGLDLPVKPEQPAAAPVPPEVQEQARAFTEPVAPQPLASQWLEREDFDAMMADPTRRDAALQAAAEGRVKLKNPRAAQIDVKDTAGFFKPR